MTTFDSRELASYVAQQCVANHYDYNKTKIQKLLYCCYGAVLALKGERICDEYPRAWQYGPVFPKVFNVLDKGIDLERYSFRVRNEAPQDVRDILDEVVLKFGKYRSSELSRWSHLPGSPWDRVVHGIGRMNDFIPDNLIADYFKNSVIRKQEAAQ